MTVDALEMQIRVFDYAQKIRKFMESSFDRDGADAPVRLADLGAVIADLAVRAFVEGCHLEIDNKGASQQEILYGIEKFLIDNDRASIVSSYQLPAEVRIVSAIKLTETVINMFIVGIEFVKLEGDMSKTRLPF